MNNIFIALAFALYATILLLIGANGKKKIKTKSDFILGGRSFGALTSAFSAEAADMSAWLFMGLPGSILLYGIGKCWIAVGLLIGTILNWCIVAKRLRGASEKYGNAETLPSYFANRFGDTNPILKRAILLSTSIIIVVFFTVYLSSGLVAGGLLISSIFDVNYYIAVPIIAIFIMSYTILGGFIAISNANVLQGSLMLFAVVFLPIITLLFLPGQAIQLPDGTMNGLQDGFATAIANFPQHFLNPLYSIPSVSSSATDAIVSEHISLVSIISDLSWGLGYFGMPHIIVRYMAIKDESEVKKSAIIAISWVTISLIAISFVGIIGRAVFGTNVPGSAENVFIQLLKINFIDGRFNIPFIAGIFLCALVAAIMSTAAAQLIMSSSVIADNLIGSDDQKNSRNNKSKVKSNDKSKAEILINRVVIIIVTIIALLISLKPDNSIMGLVSNAWAGFGAAFGPLVLYSLYSTKTNPVSAIAGIITGGLTVIIYDYLPLNTFGYSGTLYELTGLYSLVPGFFLSAFVIFVTSRKTN
ncbi:MAG: sodium/proline symporter [Bifidobacteriaceae bacterium]|jgi:sodium/proline symporter|nr:sodium/proline symporter [Bifidobacteriaceae bacterium]